MAFVVRGKSGKVVGTYATRGEAERRIAQLKAGAERLRRFQFAGGQHSWRGQPRRHAKAARLGHRRAQRSPDKFPSVSMSWGVMPPFADFAARVGNSYPIEAHANSIDGKLLRRLRVQPSGVGEYGKNRYVLSPKQLYGLVNRLSNMVDPEGLASLIMETLGYEWI